MFKDILIPYVNEESLEAPLRAAVALAAVSYTHLDVYKRQLSGLLPLSVRTDRYPT